MRLDLRPLILLASLVAPLAADDEVPSSKPFGIDKRVPWTTSRLVGSPDPPAPYRVVKAFPKLVVENPIYIEREPGTSSYLLIHQTKAWSGAGRIRRFENKPDVADTQLLLESDRLIYGLTFHPDYKTNGYLYVCSNGPLSEKNKHSRVSRFTVSREAPFEIVPESELVILEWESNGHNGGDLEFGPDGMLYFPTGDGTSDSDPLLSGQDLSNLLAIMVRIDVDHPDEDKPYSIPPDNPFLDVKDARPEAWAFGFRNPWRMTFDRKTGHLWVGNNGQDLWEQVFFVRRGENYGWSVYEGGHPFQLGRPRGPSPIVKPALEHPHSEARSLTGGVVYYGAKLPDLEGAYIYGDWSTGRIWGARHDGDRVTWHNELARTTLQITGFGLGHDDELLICDHGDGIYRLEKNTEVDASGKFPTKLSQTGLFKSVKEDKVHAGVIPYSVVAPVWADGASQQRYLALPGTSSIESNKMPDGAVLMKTLSLEMKSGDPSSRRRIETQVLVKQLDEWLGYSYRWTDDQSDAELVDAAGKDHVFTREEHRGEARQHPWRFASRIECMACHSRAAGFVLGFKPQQLDRMHNYGDTTDNQLRTLAHAGVFDKRPESPEHTLVDPYDSSHALEERARSYLDVNCAICHVLAGGGNALMQLDLKTSLDKTNIIDVKPQHDRFGIGGAKLIAAGDPYRSVLYYRMAKLGGGRMPRTGSASVDDAGLQLLRQWIASMPVTEDEHTEVAAKLRTKQLAALINLSDKTATKESRDKSVNRLLSTTSGAMLLTRAVEAGGLRGELRNTVIARAISHAQPATRDLFERFVPPDRRTQRLGSNIDPQRILAIEGDAERGKTLFFNTAEVQCNNCHQIGDEPVSVGPSLTHIGQQSSRSQLLESILEPSKKIDDKYRAYLIETADGRVLAGVLLSKTDDEVVLRDAQNKEVRIAVDNIVELLPQTKSLMPELLARDLTAQQLADLIEFLAGLKE